ncbi:MAG: thioredoxin domain-containing protein [Alphaproteobacteria bacterium]
MSANLLDQETSPYLRQHQNNPVHWQPWGQPALARAAMAGKPILLSIGYAACHWCHVMAHESFEDRDTAALMNRLFVNIKVDREERPDIDAIYMAALHLLGQPGGWPLTMFLSANGEPYWGGTYFPPAAAHGRPSFRDVLREMARLHDEEPATIDHNRQMITRRLNSLAELQSTDEAALSMGDAETAADHLAALIDPESGGVRGAPKFPQCAVFTAIAEAGIRRNDHHLLSLFLTTMVKISQGGIYDHIGGGFARYSVDDEWLVPHFEKMLYDNAALIEALSLAHQLALAHQMPGAALFGARVEATVTWLLREMRLPQGGFAASLDADTQGEEGRYYVWEKAEIDQVLGSDAREFCRHYAITEPGNWQGTNIPNRLHAGNDPDNQATLVAMRAKLADVRAKRPKPSRDDKVLADWNGQMICALVHAALVFDRPDWLTSAEQAFEFIATKMSNKGLLYHSSRDGKMGAQGQAGDYANMAAAALALYEAGGTSGSKTVYLSSAQRWMESLENQFSDQRGGYYMTAKDAPNLIIRPRSSSDDATPNVHGIALEAYTRLECFTGNTCYGARTRAIATVFAGPARANPFGHASLLSAVARHHARMDIVITGPAGDQLAQELFAVASTALAPGRTLLRLRDTVKLPKDHAAASKPADRTCAYVCSRQTCSAPLTSAGDLKAEIEARCKS